MVDRLRLEARAIGVLDVSGIVEIQDRRDQVGRMRSMRNSRWAARRFAWPRA